VAPSVNSSNGLSIVPSDTSGDTTGDRSINSSKDLTPPFRNGGVNGGVKIYFDCRPIQIHDVTASFPVVFCCPTSFRTVQGLFVPPSNKFPAKEAFFISGF